MLRSSIASQLTAKDPQSVYKLQFTLASSQRKGRR